MLKLDGMGKRRKSKEPGIFDSVIGFAVLVGFLWLISLIFRYGMQILLPILAIVLLVILMVWIVYKILKSESPSSTFGTFAFDFYQPRDHTGDKISTTEPELPSAAPGLTMSEKLRKIDWFQFEKLVELIYQHRGFSVQRSGGANPDGGVDLIIESQTEKFVVQCKQWRKWTVGVRQIREFLGTLTDTKITKGIFITLTGYTGEAKQLADKHGIQILNESDVIKMLEEPGLKDAEKSTRFFPTPGSSVRNAKAKWF